MSVLSYQSLKSLILGAAPMIKIEKNRLDDLLQPASIDCPLGATSYHVPSSGIPRRNELVSNLLDRRFFEWSLHEGSFLEKGHTYIIPLDMELSLGSGLYAEFSPKSTTGRNDVFVRVLMNGWDRFDVSPRGYAGGLWLEVTPLSYPIRVSPGLALTQMRVKDKEEPLTNDELERIHSQYGIVRGQDGEALPHKSLSVRQEGIFLHVDLSFPMVGLEARDCAESVMNLGEKETHDPKRFFSPVYRSDDGTCILSPGRFYLLRTKEHVLIPPDYCAWMKPYDVASGEFRSHYAGFFDNGFGGREGTVGVLEVRVTGPSFRICDDQPICHFAFERTDHTPDILYGGNYTERGPSLAKNFKDRYKAWEEEYWRR